MKNKILKGVMLGCTMALLFACNAKKTETVDKEQIKKDIQARENEYADVYNSRVSKNIGYYADDAISYSQNKAPLVGKPAIVEYLKANLDTTSNAPKLSFTTNEVYPENDGSLVVEIGYYKLVDSANTIVNSGNYISIFEKRDGKYVCIRDMSTSDMTIE